MCQEPRTARRYIVREPGLQGSTSSGTDSLSSSAKLLPLFWLLTEWGSRRLCHSLQISITAKFAQLKIAMAELKEEIVTYQELLNSYLLILNDIMFAKSYTTFINGLRPSDAVGLSFFVKLSLYSSAKLFLNKVMSFLCTWFHNYWQLNTAAITCYENIAKYQYTHILGRCRPLYDIYQVGLPQTTKKKFYFVSLVIRVKLSQGCRMQMPYYSYTEYRYIFDI